MPAVAPNLPAYFARIGYRGPTDATVETLRALQRHHTRSIPFENLDVLLGRRIALDVPALERKLVRERRGGYCFEQNTLFAAVLGTLGFAVVPLAGRVRWQVPPEVTTGRTHMLLRVTAEGADYIVDVGFGSLSLTGPLALGTSDEQPTPHEPRRLVRRDGLVFHEARLGNEWAEIYRFSLEPQLPIDYEIANWFTSTHPESRFVQNLVAARADDGRRYTLQNAEFATRHLDGRVDKLTLTSADELVAVLAEYFGLHFPAGTRFGRSGAPWPT